MVVISGSDVVLTTDSGAVPGRDWMTGDHLNLQICRYMGWRCDLTFEDSCQPLEDGVMPQGVPAVFNGRGASIEDVVHCGLGT